MSFELLFCNSSYGVPVIGHLYLLNFHQDITVSNTSWKIM